MVQHMMSATCAFHFRNPRIFSRCAALKTSVFGQYVFVTDYHMSTSQNRWPQAGLCHKRSICWYASQWAMKLNKTFFLLTISTRLYTSMVFSPMVTSWVSSSFGQLRTHSPGRSPLKHKLLLLSYCLASRQIPKKGTGTELQNWISWSVIALALHIVNVIYLQLCNTT